MTSTQMLTGSPLPGSPWPLMLGAYFILTGLASGVALLCWWVRPGDSRAADTVEWSVSLVAMGAMSVALFILVLDLGQPARFFLMLTEFDNLGSIMSVGAKLIAAKTFFLGLYIYLIHRRRRGLSVSDQPAPVAVSRAFSVAVPVLLGITSLALAVYPAFLLARTWMSPLAATPGSGLLFLSTAMIMGASMAVIIVAASPNSADQEFHGRLVRALLFLVIVELVLLLLEGLSLIGRGPALSRVLHDIVAGQSAVIFWGLVVTAGLAVPLVGLLAMPRHRLAMMVGAAGALVGAGATRFLIFVVS